MQTVTLAIGTLSVFLSIGLSVFFARSSKSLGRAMTFMLAAEAIMSACTVAFTVWDVLYDTPIPETISIALRWVIFTVVSLSSIHLSVEIWKVIRDVNS